MIDFITDGNDLVLKYEAEQEDASWVDRKIDEDGVIILHKCLFLSNSHLISTSTDEHPSERLFKIGNKEQDYYKIDKNILNLKFDLLLSIQLNITTKTFIAVGNISIFSKIDKLIEEPIIIGGEKEGAIPLQDFNKFLKLFPTRTTLVHFANARITGLLNDYFDTMPDAQRKLEEHLERKKRNSEQISLNRKQNNIPKPIREYETVKYKYIYESIKEMLLHQEAYSEKDWQIKIIQFIILLFPKYLTVLENVRISDFYSNPIKDTKRFIDLSLVDANGNIDIIELKKPMNKNLLYSTKYRDNYTPTRELSGAVMQVEKYIFHLNKFGVEGERKLQEAYRDLLPPNIKIKITNPSGLIIIGRDKDFSGKQNFDFEIIKRHYANIIDIMTYDDLLNRLKNMIHQLEVKYE